MPHLEFTKAPILVGTPIRRFDISNTADAIIMTIAKDGAECAVTLTLPEAQQIGMALIVGAHEAHKLKLDAIETARINGLTHGSPLVRA